MTDYNRKASNIRDIGPFADSSEDAISYDNYVTDREQTESASVIDLDCNEGLIEEHLLLPEGKYEMHYLDHELHKNYHGFGNKLVIRFEISKGDYQGGIIEKFYNVKLNEGGGFTVRGGTSYWRHMRQLFPEKTGIRRDRLPPSLLKGKTLIASVRTVKSGKKKRILLPDEQYSVVDELLRII